MTHEPSSRWARHSDSTQPKPAENPYVGPRAFRPGEKLFGRGHETETFVHLLIADRIVLLHSQSGAGKTSLLHANVLPRLGAEGFETLPIARLNKALPFETPSCNRYVMSVLIDWESRHNEKARDPRQLSKFELHTYLEDARDATHVENGPPPKPKLLVFDQFEELFTLDAADLEAKREFCRQAGLVLQDRSRWAVFAMREEFMGALDPYLGLLPTRLSSRCRLELLSPEDAREAITGPALACKDPVAFAPKAVDRLVAELRKIRQQVKGNVVEVEGPFIEPVQLQVVCKRLWERLPSGIQEVDEHHLGSVGDVDEALGEYYADAVHRAAEDGAVPERDVRHWVETVLIVNRVRGQALMGSEATRGVSAGAVTSLEGAYILRREERRGGIWFELSHDRLVAPVLQDNARWRDVELDEIDRMAMRWDEEGRPDRLLVFSPAMWRRLPVTPGESRNDRSPGSLVFSPVMWIRLLATLRRDAPDSPLSLKYQYLVAAMRRLWRNAAIFYGGALAVAVVVPLIFSFFESRQENTRLRQKSDSLAIVVDSLTKLQMTVYEQVWGLERSTPELVEQSVDANQALERYVLRSPQVSRMKVRIEYFFKRQDPERVEYVLRELGYEVEIQQARAEEVVTNAISFGSAVPLDDVRVIALAVARTGAKLRRICPFRDSRGREHVVQVIGARSASRLDVLTVKDLEAIHVGAPLPCPEGAALPRPDVATVQTTP